MNPRALWAAAMRWYNRHSQRDRRIVAGVGIAAVLSMLFVGVVEPVRAYRRGVTEEITDGREDLERAARFLAAAEGLRAERDRLAKDLEQKKSRLLPGDTATLGAAALQERTNALAAEKGITVQSTQVMREEVADPFHKVSIRLTLSGELRPFADFVASLEHGPQALTVPFVEVSRRGAVAGQKGPRTLAATVEVGGYILASAKAAKPEGETAEGEAAAEAGQAAPEGEGTAAVQGPETASAVPGEEKPAQPAVEPGKPAPPPVPPVPATPPADAKAATAPPGPPAPVPPAAAPAPPPGAPPLSTPQPMKPVPLPPQATAPAPRPAQVD